MKTVTLILTITLPILITLTLPLLTLQFLIIPHIKTLTELLSNLKCKVSYHLSHLILTRLLQTLPQMIRTHSFRFHLHHLQLRGGENEGIRLFKILTIIQELLPLNCYHHHLKSLLVNPHPSL